MLEKGLEKLNHSPTQGLRNLHRPKGAVTEQNAPYLCIKDGIILHCPQVEEHNSFWENPYSVTTSWKPCAEGQIGAILDLPPENETNRHIFIHAEGGLNQQRIDIIDTALWGAWYCS
ncbi:protein PECTIC ARABINOGALACTAN SYNTHESIS-RELATED-like [Cornus florida]|uniref:protein PECTIC ARABINOGALACTAN SYNTHESIS-RELATED-like n=1 Tax=Cornus florida TaxID=4283 RepID=UPI00289D42AE|nr:protein PECTIC ARABINOGALACTAN SYNTHESIS-RELATED-like [Cornus florida]XP_059656682.1 protein PECTIC ARABINOGALACTAN SYNTHESIS-RELATED-like [Cornus florida]